MRTLTGHTLARHLPGEASYFTRSSAASLPDPSGGSKPVVLESACTVRLGKHCLMCGAGVGHKLPWRQVECVLTIGMSTGICAKNREE